RGGSIDETGGGGGGPVQKVEREPEIGGEDQVGIGGGRVGDRAEMDDGLELAAVEPAHQLAGGYDIGDLALAEVAPFVRVAERIVDDNVGAPGLVQAGDQIGTDEAGSAPDPHHRSPAATIASPLPPGLATSNVLAPQA